MKFINDKKQFDAWRTQRPRRNRIPDQIWKLAASHVNEYGLYKVTQTGSEGHPKAKIMMTGHQLSPVCLIRGICHSAKVDMRDVFHASRQDRLGFTSLGQFNIRLAEDLTCLVMGTPISPSCSSSPSQQTYSWSFSFRLAGFHPSNSQIVHANSVWAKPQLSTTSSASSKSDGSPFCRRILRCCLKDGCQYGSPWAPLHADPLME
jgi:hypothetical protein